MASGQAVRLAVDVAGVQECLQAALEAVSAVLLADPGNRADAKSWLTTTVAHLKDVAAATKLTCFTPVSSSSSTSRARHESTHFDSKQQHRSGISNRSGHRDLRRDRSSKHSSSSRSISRSRERLQYNNSSHREPNHQQQQQQPSPISSCKAASLQLLQLLTDAQPAAVAQLLSQVSNFLCDYLTSNPSVTSSWFNHFSLSGIQNFKFGSWALANYALTHRSEVWQYLVWTGKHDQAPVAVAAKPHYFSELDVPKTLKNLAKYCPGFWQSDELLRSCEGGEWLRLNSEMITELLYHLLHHSNSSGHQQLLQLVDSYIMSADWSFLCNRLLLLLSEQQLMDFVKLVAQQQQQRVDEGANSRRQQQQQQQRVDSSGNVLLQQWLQQQTTYNTKAVAAHTPETGTAAHPPATAAAACGSEFPCVSSLPLLVLAVAQQCSTFDQLLLANVLSCHRSQLLTLLQQQDNDDTALQILHLVEVAQHLFNFQQQQQHQHQQQQQQQDLEDGEDTAAAASGAAVLPVMQYLKQQVLAADKQSAADTPQPLLLLLLVGWLLRLHLLLAAAAAADGRMQLSDVLHQLGCKCQVLSDSSGKQQQQQQQQQEILQMMDLHQAHQSNKGTKILQDLDPPQQQQQQQNLDPQQQQQQQNLDPQQQQQQQQQQNLDPQQQQQQQNLDPQQQQQQQQQQNLDLQQQQQQQNLDPQQQQQQHQGKEQAPNEPQWKPLRRGQAAVEQQQWQQDQQQQQDHKHKLKRKHSSKKHHRHKQHHKRCKRRHTTSSSEPESESEAANSTGSDAENGGKRRSGKHRKHRRSKHSRKHRRHQRATRSSSSSGGSSDSEGGSEMDFDAGGELLDPTDYKLQSQQSLLTSNDASLTRTATVPVAAAAAAAGCSEARMTAHLSAAQQQQLAEVLGRLASSSVGGKLLSGPKWLVGLPSSGSKTTRSQTLATTAVAVGAVGSSSVVRASAKDSCHVWVAGTAAEVADAAAWYCVSRWIA